MKTTPKDVSFLPPSSQHTPALIPHNPNPDIIYSLHTELIKGRSQRASRQQEREREWEKEERERERRTTERQKRQKRQKMKGDKKKKRKRHKEKEDRGWLVCLTLYGSIHTFWCLAKSGLFVLHRFFFLFDVMLQFPWIARRFVNVMQWLTHVHRCIGSRNATRQTLPTSAKLTSLSMYDSRNGATQCMWGV
jgi:hypothetical protein